MNDKFTNNNQAEDLARKINQVAEQTNVSSQFAAELEERLRSGYRPKTTGFAALFNKVSPAVVWVTLMVLLGLVLSLSIKTLIPAPQPGEHGVRVTQSAGPGPTESLAPAAVPSTTPLPPLDYTVQPGDTCAGLALDFEVSVQSIIMQNNLSADCVLSVGQKLKIPYPTPTPGQPQLPTAVPNGKSFEYNGAKLFLNAPLPDSPGQANVYTLFEAQPATEEYTRTLANQFGIDGEIYLTQGHMPDTSAFMVTDGKQQLIVYTENDYDYTSDMVKYLRNRAGSKREDAEAIIREYLKAHSLDFNFRLNLDSAPSYILEQLAEDGTPMRYAFNSGPFVNITLDEEGSVLSLKSLLASYDLHPLGQYRIISAEEALNFLLDENRPAGRLDSGSGPLNSDYEPPMTWFHDYPDGQTVTIGGEKTSYQAMDTSKPAVIFIDNLSVTGNTDGMETLSDHAYVMATGQFIVENGIRKFEADTWNDVPSASLIGSAHRAGDQIMFEDENGAKNVLIDPPVDLPLDTVLPQALYLRGAAVDGKFYWSVIQHIKDVNNRGGGGGGGGGMGFYKLNLGGTPVPFPTSTPIGTTYSPAELASFLRYTVQPGDTLEQIADRFHVSVKDLLSVNSMTGSSIDPGWQLTIPGVPGPTRLDGERGIAQVRIFEKPDGRQRTEYTFTSEKDRYFNYELKGDALEPLQKVANHPIRIWGSISFDEGGQAFLDVEKFETLYPDLKYQILKGTHETKEINGTQVSFFSMGGTSYVELFPSGGYPSEGNWDVRGDVTVEALQVPGETYAGYPAIRIYNLLQNSLNPETGKPYELAPLAENLEAMPDPFGNGDAYTSPDVTIEAVELMYVANDFYEPDAETGSSPSTHYVEPAWHFQGRDSNGNGVDILIQALEQEYLLPETLP